MDALLNSTQNLILDERAAELVLPVVAISTLVNGVRLFLVALICLLLLKLRAPVDLRSTSNRSKSSSFTFRTRQQQINTNDTVPGDRASWLKIEVEQVDGGSHKSRIYIRIIIKLSKLISYLMAANTQTMLDGTKSQPLAQMAANKRRVSQPSLMPSSQQQVLPNQLQDRRRRHSDTCLAHLNLPPGPMGLPFLGYLPFVGHEIHLTLSSLSERYGPIYQIFLGGIRVVVLNDAALVRQAFKQPVFSGRPDTKLMRILQGYGIVNSDGDLWKEQRAFVHTALRKLGAKSLLNGANGLESRIQKQVKEFVDDLSSLAIEEKSCQVRPMVARAVSSVVGSIVMNLTYRKYEDKEKFDRLIDLMQEGFRLFAIAMPLDFIPIFRFLPGVSYAYNKLKKNRAETSAFFQDVADEHRKYLSETFNLDASSPAKSRPLHPSLSGHDLGGSQTGETPYPSQASPPPPPSPPPSSFQPPPLSSSPSPCPAPSRADFLVGRPTSPTSRLSRHSAGNKQDKQVLVGSNGQGGADSAKVGSLDADSAQCDVQTGINNYKAAQSGQEKQVELDDIVARDLVDAYLVEQRKHEKGGKDNYFSDQQLVQIMSDIFSAGLETVTSTIEWSILFLILNTECQEKIQVEIDNVIGRERMPSLEDLSNMPYTEATIFEVLRRSNIVALGNAHATLNDATIAGYRIPKGTQVLPNLYRIHMNPKTWDQPDKFNPDRFIVNDKTHKPDHFIPFSVGRRMCLGDVLAKMEVFLFLVGLLQRYDLSVADEDRDKPPQVKGTIGVSNSPASFKVSIRNRQKSGGSSRKL